MSARRRRNRWTTWLGLAAFGTVSFLIHGCTNFDLLYAQCQAAGQCVDELPKTLPDGGCFTGPFYVDDSPPAADTNSGLSPSAAWADLDPLLHAKLCVDAGVSVLFRPTGVWQFPISLVGVKNLTIDTYDGGLATFKGPGLDAGSALYVSQVSNLSIKHLSIVNWLAPKGAILVGSGAEHVIFDGLFISDAGAAGVTVGPPLGLSVSNISLVNSTLTNIPQQAINIRPGVVSFTGSSNTLTNVGLACVSDTGAGSVYVGNDLANCGLFTIGGTWDGMRFTGSNGYAAGNTIAGATGAALSLRAQSEARLTATP